MSGELTLLDDILSALCSHQDVQSIDGRYNTKVDSIQPDGASMGRKRRACVFEQGKTVKQ